jgi:small GTP-binding protein
MMAYDSRFTVLFVGNSTVGKSSLIVRYSDGVFNDEKATIGVDMKTRTVVLNKKRIKFDIFDASGQELYKNITRHFYRGANAVVLTYDVTDRKTFLQIPTWLAEIKKHDPQNKVMMLVANKCDLQHPQQVERSEGESLATEYKMTFLETSARLNTGVDEIFTEAGRQLNEQQEEGLKKYDQLS